MIVERNPNALVYGLLALTLGFMAMAFQGCLWYPQADDVRNLQNDVIKLQEELGACRAKQACQEPTAEPEPSWLRVR